MVFSLQTWRLIFCVYLKFMSSVCPAHINLFDLITVLSSGEEGGVSHYAIFSGLLRFRLDISLSKSNACVNLVKDPFRLNDI